MSTTLGPFAFATVHLIFIVSSILALSAAWWLGKSMRTSLSDAVFRIIAVGLISARLYFVIKYVDIYLAAPWQIINVRDGGFSLWAGLAAGAAWTVRELIVLHRKNRLQHAPQQAQAAGLRRGQLGLVGALLIGLTVFSGGHLWLNQHIGQTQFPQASLQQLNGPPVNLAEAFHGKPTVVNLWASWCPPCVREMPLLEDAADNWPDVHIVAVNQGEESAQVDAFLQQQGLALPHVLLDQRSQVGAMVGSHALPTTLFFNSDGSLSYTHIGEFSAATLENALRRLD